jgi:hypothetical protein
MSAAAWSLLAGIGRGRPWPVGVGQGGARGRWWTAWALAGREMRGRDGTGLETCGRARRRGPRVGL